MTDFQVGDRVSVEGIVTQELDTGAYVKIDYPQPIHHFFPTGALTLIERPKRKLRVGSVWECNGAQRYVYLGKDMFSAWLPNEPNVERSRITLDETPDLWREVPVAELESEAQ